MNSYLTGFINLMFGVRKEKKLKLELEKEGKERKI